MKILMLTGNSSLLDGINRHILNICPALNSLEDVEVRVCTVLPHGDLNCELESMGVKTYALGFPHGHSIGIFNAYKMVCDEFSPDIVHVHVMSIVQRLFSSYFGRKIKYVETIHGISDPQIKSIKNLVEHAVIKCTPIKMSARCFISRGVKDALAPQYSDNAVIDVCYNPISFNKVYESDCSLRKLIGVDNDVKIIGTACRISKVKNPVLFTKIMCDVLVKVPKVHAVIMGTGDQALLEDCETIVTDYNVNERFHWLGYRPDAAELVADLSCFVMTSTSEGMPTPVLEAFVAKTPVAMFEGKGGLVDIASLSSPTRPIVALAPFGDEARMVANIVDILDDDSFASALAENSYLVGRQNFGLDNVISQLYSIYSSVL